MRRQDMLASKIEALNTRWERISQLLNGLYQQRDTETRVEEQMRLERLITEREAQRQQVEAELQALEDERRSLGDMPGSSTPPVPSVKTSRPMEVFYSYAHADEALRDQLDKHLSILTRQNVISGWHDRAIAAGREWENQIDVHLEAADIILLLVSADFIASDYCWGKELKRAMARHEAGEARVIPILLRPVNWTGAPFSKLQALPKDARPVTSWPNQDEAFADIVSGIRQVATELARTS